jgi:hypothetical protein
MKRFIGLALVALGAALALWPASREASAGPKEDKVLFLVLPNKLLGDPHLDIKNGKVTEIEVVAMLGGDDGMNVSEINLPGVKLATGKYLAGQCKLSGKDVKASIQQIYFSRKLEPKMKLSGIVYKGEATATYKLAFGGGKGQPVHVFEASVGK